MACISAAAGLRFLVNSSGVQYIPETSTLTAEYDYNTTQVTIDEGVNGAIPRNLLVTPVRKRLTFQTDCHVPRVGCMLVGWGGNNGSTLTATVEANKRGLSWKTKELRWIYLHNISTSIHADCRSVIVFPFVFNVAGSKLLWLAYSSFHH